MALNTYMIVLTCQDVEAPNFLASSEFLRCKIKFLRGVGVFS